MTVLHMNFLPKGDSGPAWPEIAPIPLIAHGALEVWATVIDGGMSSGQPSVALQFVSKGKLVVLELSLNNLLALAVGMSGMAQVQFGWVQPE